MCLSTRLYCLKFRNVASIKHNHLIAVAGPINLWENAGYELKCCAVSRRAVSKTADDVARVGQSERARLWWRWRRRDGSVGDGEMEARSDTQRRWRLMLRSGSGGSLGVPA